MRNENRKKLKDYNCSLRWKRSGWTIFPEDAVAQRHRFDRSFGYRDTAYWILGVRAHFDLSTASGDDVGGGSEARPARPCVGVAVGACLVLPPHPAASSTL